jgi:hypothetical protein
VRDARDFLGMPPQRFLKQVTPLMRQSMAVRTSVLGGPVQALHLAGAPGLTDPYNAGLADSGSMLAAQLPGPAET